MTRPISIVPGHVRTALRSSPVLRADFASMHLPGDIGSFHDEQERLQEKNFAKLLEALLAGSPFGSAPSIVLSVFCRNIGQKPNEVFVAMAENVCAEISRSGEYRSPGVILNRRFAQSDVPGIHKLIDNVRSGALSFE
ncbi:MAG: hypothetical protein U0R44_00925 [Candidatus Micrarchaeia archaeon]